MCLHGLVVVSHLSLDESNPSVKVGSQKKLQAMSYVEQAAGSRQGAGLSRSGESCSRADGE